MELKICIFILIICNALNCKHELNQVMPSEVRPYVIDFFSEAQKHGLNLNMEHFDFSISFTKLTGTDGSCRFANKAIKLDSAAWRQNDDIYRRYLIFHELGHCILGRLHETTKTDCEECLSIMRGGQKESFFCNINLHSSRWWTFYLKELFDEKIEMPNWSEPNETYFMSENKKAYQIKIDNKSARQHSFELISLDETRNFDIEFEFKNWVTLTWSTAFVKWDDKTFSCCPTCSNSRKTQLTEFSATPFYTYTYFQCGKAINKGDIKLTIRKREDFSYFFINEQLIYNTEYLTIKKPNFRGNFFDDSTTANVRFYYFN